MALRNKPRLIKRIAKCLLYLIFFLGSQSIFSQASTQKEIEQLFEKLYKLGSANADSTNALVLKSYLKSKEIGYEEGIHRAMALSISHLTDKEDYDSAKALSNALLKIVKAKKYPNDLAKGTAFLFSGTLHRQLRDFDISRALYLDALSVFEQLNNSYFIGIAYGNFGGLEYTRANYDESLSYYLKAYEIKLRNEIDPQSYAADMYGISLCYYALDHKEEAFTYAIDAYKILKKSGSTLNLARVSQFIGVLWGKSNKDSAIFYFNKSIMIAESVGNQQTAFVAKRAVAHLYSDSDVQKSNAILIELLNDSSKVGETPKGRQNRMLVYSSLAFNYVRSKEYRKCIFYSRKGIDLIMRTDSLNSSNPNLGSLNALTGYLGVSYEGLKIYDSALHFNRIQLQVKDTLNNIRERKRFTKLYSQIENLKNDLEISSLENQREDDVLFESILIVVVISIALLGVVIIVIIWQRHKFKQEEMTIERIKIQHIINKRERDFEQQALSMINLNNRISEFEDSINSLELKKSDLSTSDFQMLLNKITMAKSMEIEWRKFENYFSDIHKDLVRAIYKKHPDISTTEIRLIALIRLSLSSKEMADILNIEPRSITMYKYRLKKKFGLGPEDDLDDYLNKLQETNEPSLEKQMGFSS